MAGRSISLYFMIFVVGLLLINNAINYVSLKRELHEAIAAQIREVSAQIKISVERSQLAYRYVDSLMASNLRSAAIAVKYALPPSHEQVDDERLRELSEELGVSDITLFAKTSDDVVSVRSSDPREINQSTKTWDNYHEAFLQLFDRQMVNGLSYGLSMKNFWAGEIAPSATIPSSTKNKFGFFYDGTTDYLINPIMDADYIDGLERYTGVEKILQDTVDQHDLVLEIALFNPLSFSLPEEELVNIRGGKRVAQYRSRKILFGTYRYSSPDDADRIASAFETDAPQQRIERLNERQVYRTFIPVRDEQFGQPYVIGITMDYEYVRARLREQFLNMALVTGIALAASAAIIALCYRYWKRARDDVAQAVQDDYNDEMQSLFVAVRGERHDFVNHLNTLKAMADLKRYDQLGRYVKELVDETAAVSDIVNIGHPAVAAIIQSKSAVALRQRIDFAHRFAGMSELAGIRGVKSVDLVKILANLIDNAFEEVKGLVPERRIVRVQGWIERQSVVFSVSNSLSRPLSEAELERIFLPSYTTKANSAHSGLGLSIVREKARQYRGRVTVSTPSADTIEFVVSVPVEG